MCARALQVAYVRGRPAPLRWGSEQRLLLVWSFSPAFPFALVKVRQGICLLSEPEGRLGTTESLPAPPPRLCLQMRKQTRQTGKSHMKSRRCAASSDSASSAPSVPRLCLSSAFQPRPASLAVGGNGGNKQHLVEESSSPHLGLPPSPSLWGHASLEPPGPGLPLRSY